MTAGLFGAIAADGKIGLVRQCGKEVERSAVVRGCHLRSVLLDEGGPLAFCFGALRQSDRFRTGRKVGEPHVVPILRSILAFRDASRWPPNGSDTQTFTDDSIGT